MYMPSVLKECILLQGMHPVVLTYTDCLSITTQRLSESRSHQLCITSLLIYILYLYIICLLYNKNNPPEKE
jgi:hypothetical protein